MGLKIHYCGDLRSLDEVDALICDVADICLAIGWRMMPVHPSNIMPGKGIIITPEGCESIWLTFISRPSPHNTDTLPTGFATG